MNCFAHFVHPFFDLLTDASCYGLGAAGFYYGRSIEMYFVEYCLEMNFFDLHYHDSEYSLLLDCLVHC